MSQAIHIFAGHTTWTLDPVEYSDSIWKSLSSAAETTIYANPNSKPNIGQKFTVINETSYTQYVKADSAATGISIRAGTKAEIYWNGYDFESETDSVVDEVQAATTNQGESITSLEGDTESLITNLTELSSGKNKWDTTKAVAGRLDRFTGLPDSDVLYLTSGFMEIPSGATHIVPSLKYSAGSSSRTVSYQRCCFYDVNRANIGTGLASGTAAIAVIPPNAKEVRISQGATTVDIMIEFNTTGVASDYEVYTESLKAKPPKFSELVPEEKIDLFGDSLTAGTGSTNLGTGYLRGYSYVLNDLLTDGKTIFNAGAGGAGIEDICVRQGGASLFCKPFTIPADTSAAAITLFMDDGTEPRTFPTHTGQGLNPVTISGIQGNLSYDSGTTTNYFTRLAAGTATTLTRDTKIITNGSRQKGGILVIWAGSNNSPDATEMESLLPWIDNMISYNGNDKYIVLGLTCKSYMADIVNVNKVLAKKYGFHFLDIRRYLLDYGLADAAITPTAQDTTDIAAGEIPTSLRVDEIHFNDAGYTIIGNLVYKKGVELGYWR